MEYLILPGIFPDPNNGDADTNCASYCGPKENGDGPCGPHCPVFVIRCDPPATPGFGQS